MHRFCQTQLRKLFWNTSLVGCGFCVDFIFWELLITKDGFQTYSSSMQYPPNTFCQKSLLTVVLLEQHIPVIQTSPNKNIFCWSYQHFFTISCFLLFFCCSSKRVFICLTELGRKTEVNIPSSYVTVVEVCIVLFLNVSLTSFYFPGINAMWFYKILW